MNDSWSLEEIFNSVSDDIFNDAIKCFDFPLEDLEPNNVSGEEWDAGFHILEPPPPPPPTNVLAGFSSSLLHGGCLSDDSDKRFSLSPDQASQLNLRTSVNEASSSRSILLPGNNVDVKYPGLFQTSSPVSVLESSSSCSAENPTPSYSMLNFPVKKRARSNKRRPASALNLQFLLPPIHSSSSASRESCSFGASEVESDNYAEKPGNKKQKKKWHPTLSPSGDESIESTSEQQVAVRKCMHCGVTKTPQWREGPMGPKTLCNACGVRYRSGRLLPEYRPAASPTFIPSIHSNSHKKVIELRKKSKLQPHIGFPGTLLPPATCNLA